MSRGDLSDADWRILEMLLPPENGREGRPAFDNRRTIDGILWRLRTGAPWRDVPERYDNWNSIFRRFRRWSQSGIWEAIAVSLADALADHRHHSIDSTTVRGHTQAAGAKGGLNNMRLAALVAGSPVRFTVSPMRWADRWPSISRAAKFTTRALTQR